MATIVMSDNRPKEVEYKVLMPEDTWSEMTIDQLIEQKNILFERWKFLVENDYKYATDVKKGLDKIEAFIAKR
jgi:hypothetical protein